MLAYYRVVFSYLDAGRIPSQQASEQTSKRTSFFFHHSSPNSGLPRTKNKNKRGSRKSKYMVEIDYLQTLPPPHRPLLPSQLIPANFSPSCLTHACRPQDPGANYRFFESSFFKKIKIQKVTKRLGGLQGCQYP